jgi:hypothetical protein
LRYGFIVPEIWRDSPIEERKAFGAIGSDHRYQLGGCDIIPGGEIHHHICLKPFFQFNFTFAKGVSSAHDQRVNVFLGKLEIMCYKFNCPTLNIKAFYSGRS